MVPLLFSLGLLGLVLSTPTDCPGPSCLAFQQSILSRPPHPQSIHQLKKINLEIIKDGILKGLGMEKPPNVTRKQLSEIDRMPFRDEEQIPTTTSTPDTDQRIIYMYAKQGMAELANDSYTNTMQFSSNIFSKKGRPGTLKVTNAQLNILVKYPRLNRNAQNPPRHVTLQVYQVYPDSDRPDTLVSTFSNIVRHTKWQKLVLPTTTLQRFLDERASGSSMYLRIVCPQCRPGVLEPVMLFKKKSGANSRRSAIATRVTRKSKPKTTRRRKKRRDKKERVNKRRPFIVVIAQKDAVAAKQQRRQRGKRHIAECDAGGCCKHDMFMTFHELGWDDWILKPEGLFANYCEGKCSASPKSPHDIFAHDNRQTIDYFKVREKTCRATKTSPVELLYINEDGNIIKAKVPDMSIQGCGCA